MTDLHRAIRLSGMAIGISVTFALAGCVATAPPVPQPDWQSRCTADQVTASKTCRAFTFGERLASDGSRFNGRNIPFQVFYIGSSGPYIQAGFHTFPGRRPVIRFDDDTRTYTVSDDGGVSNQRPDPLIVARMKSATVARVRYHVWPEGQRDMIVDLAGLNDALQQLDQIRR